MSKVLVTGASGFVGAKCLPRLLKAGFEVHALSRQTQELAAKNLHWHKADVLDPVTTEKLIQSIKPSHLVHLAWCCDQQNYWMTEQNIVWAKASFNLCRSFAEAGGMRVLCTGTAAEYRDSFDQQDEVNSEIQSSSLYGGSKIALHSSLSRHLKNEDLSIVWARIFFAYGPGEKGTRVIPSVIKALGNNHSVKCSSGKQIRDFIYVEDVAEILVRLLQSELTGAYNVGSGESRDLKSVLQEIGKQFNKVHLVEFDALSTPWWDSPYLVAANQRLVNDLGWSKFTSIEKGIQETIQYWKEKAEAGQP